MAHAAHKRPTKNKALQRLEYAGVRLIILLAKIVPLRAGHLISRVLSRLIYTAVPPRRATAVENLRHAFGEALGEAEIQELVLKSCASVVAGVFETVKFRSMLNRPGDRDRLRQATDGFEALLAQIKLIHEKSGGCVFVTPHLGNWEFLPYVGTLSGIPLVIVVRNLRNMYLERLLFSERAASGQIIIPNINALMLMQEALQRGKSVGMLPDQSTRKGIAVEYFGRPALTTPIPAILALLYKRPIVVVACCRTSPAFRFEGCISEPIWPDANDSEKEEVHRLTREMNSRMESMVRKYPDQYLWMHNRWKGYRTRTEVSL
jgi:KDO2-lipid IV(A) lauroyltransferase